MRYFDGRRPRTPHSGSVARHSLQAPSRPRKTGHIAPQTPPSHPTHSKCTPNAEGWAKASRYSACVRGRACAVTLFIPAREQESAPLVNGTQWVVVGDRSMLYGCEKWGGWDGER